jgi:Ca2+-binding EF-hand superfamily protein
MNDYGLNGRSSMGVDSIESLVPGLADGRALSPPQAYARIARALQKADTDASSDTAAAAEEEEVKPGPLKGNTHPARETAEGSESSISKKFEPSVISAVSREAAELGGASAALGSEASADAVATAKVSPLADFLLAKENAEFRLAPFFPYLLEMLTIATEPAKPAALMAIETVCEDSGGYAEILTDQREEWEKCAEATIDERGLYAIEPPACVTMLERGRLRSIFDKADIQHRGSLHLFELMDALSMMGKNADGEAAKQIFHAFELEEESGSIKFQEFVRLYENHMLPHLPSAAPGSLSIALQPAVIRQNIVLHSAFRSIDEDNDGLIDHNDLASALVQLDANTGDNGAAELLHELDLDEKGKLTFEEFANGVVGSSMFARLIDQENHQTEPKDSIWRKISTTMNNIFSPKQSLEVSFSETVVSPFDHFSTSYFASESMDDAVSKPVSDTMVREALNVWVAVVGGNITSRIEKEQDKEKQAQLALLKDVLHDDENCTQLHALQLFEAAKEAEPKMTPLLKNIADECVTRRSSFFSYLFCSSEVSFFSRLLPQGWRAVSRT